FFNFFLQLGCQLKQLLNILLDVLLVLLKQSFCALRFHFRVSFRVGASWIALRSVLGVRQPCAKHDDSCSRHCFQNISPRPVHWLPPEQRAHSSPQCYTPPANCLCPALSISCRV